MRGIVCLNILLLTAHMAVAQSGADASSNWWSLHYQATALGQSHGDIASPYEGANSLPGHAERRVSLTATLFGALRVGSHTEFVVNPEIAGGRGFGTVTGIAGFPNGEIPRVSAATPTLYLARGYMRNTWALGSEMETVEDAPNQVRGTRAVARYTSVVGRFALSDFFDNNAYSHDPRTQFANWAIMDNGAWDYPADVRGYTVGTMQELATKWWALRAAVALEPTVANGPDLDWHIARNRGTVFEYEQRYNVRGRMGTVRTLGYWNRARGGNYREALRTASTPDITSVRRNGTAKYGAGFNVEQPIADGIGAFARYGWSDGKTESWAFTEIDRTASGGVLVQGRRWHRTKDAVGIAAARNYLSGDHRSYLARGGMGFIVGDGRLNYAPESSVEAYYAWRALPMVTLTFDYQHIDNPGYNRDRGPVNVYSLRLHIEQ